jgi:hypothetical protein
MGFRISVFESAELQATILALRGMDKELAKQIRDQTRKVVEPVWAKAVAEETTTRLEVRTFAQNTRVLVSNQTVTLKAGHIGRAFKSGTKPFELTAAVEFGADQDRVRSVTRRTKKGSVTYKRHTTHQLRPRNPKGYVVWQAAANVIPRVASLWVQTTVRTFHEAFERR